MYEHLPGVLEFNAGPFSATGPGFLTISGQEAPIIWEQSDFGSGSGVQFAVVDVDTFGAGGAPSVTVALHAGGGGKGAELVVRVDTDRTWEIVAGTKKASVSAIKSTDSFLGGTFSLRFKRLFRLILDLFWLSCRFFFM